MKSYSIAIHFIYLCSLHCHLSDILTVLFQMAIVSPMTSKGKGIIIDCIRKASKSHKKNMTNEHKRDTTGPTGPLNELALHRHVLLVKMLLNLLDGKTPLGTSGDHWRSRPDSQIPTWGDPVDLVLGCLQWLRQAGGNGNWLVGLIQWFKMRRYSRLHPSFLACWFDHFYSLLACWCYIPSYWHTTDAHKIT